MQFMVPMHGQADFQATLRASCTTPSAQLCPCHANDMLSIMVVTSYVCTDNLLDVFILQCIQLKYQGNHPIAIMFATIIHVQLYMYTFI